MKQLNEYLNQCNRMRTLFKQPMLEVYSAEGRKLIADKLEADLSPENLCMDGEASAAYVRKRSRLLNNAAKQLMTLDTTITVEV